MLSENLRVLRKKKGLSQEELVARVKVVRQTVSKWEKGLSVPDADLLVALAEVLEVSTAELLGGAVPDRAEPSEIAQQLSRINEQLAVKNRRSRRIWKIMLGILAAFLAFQIFLVLTASISAGAFSEHTSVEVIPITEGRNP